ncbi:MAG TPA: iron ABC transporter permease [Eubacteriaceae bacterium]|nr:iron ABC transporter permease [Eubacteriaceae bacterium]
MIILLVLVLGSALYAMSVGSAEMNIFQVLKTLFGYGSDQSYMVVYNIRLPRAITAITAGIGLAGAGCVMQSVLKNPLASASTLGIAQGAAFGASFAIIVLGAGMQSQTLGGTAFTNPYLVSLCAFASAMFSTLMILGLSHIRKVSAESMILAGVALSTMFAGATTLLQYFATDVRVAAVVFWTFGDLGRTGWQEILIMSTVVAGALIFFMANRWNFNALQNGEETAKGLGVNVKQLRIFAMLVSSLTAATIVAYVGIINFIGLIAPHLIRRFVGSDYRYLLPASALAGAFLLLASDILARILVAPIILPIGAITSFLGAPMFLYLLYRGVGKQ